MYFSSMSEDIRHSLPFDIIKMCRISDVEYNRRRGKGRKKRKEGEIEEEGNVEGGR